MILHTEFKSLPLKIEVRMGLQSTDSLLGSLAQLAREMRGHVCCRFCPLRSEIAEMVRESIHNDAADECKQNSSCSRF